jgi:hypothetical protein
MLYGSRSTGGSKRYCGSYGFTDEPLLPGGTSLILSAAFDDLVSTCLSSISVYHLYVHFSADLTG